MQTRVFGKVHSEESVRSLRWAPAELDLLSDSTSQLRAALDDGSIRCCNPHSSFLSFFFLLLVGTCASMLVSMSGLTQGAPERRLLYFGLTTGCSVCIVGIIQTSPVRSGGLNNKDNQPLSWGFESAEGRARVCAQNTGSNTG